MNLKRAFEGGMLTCPTFSNLTSLVLGDWVMTADFYPLHRILQLSDKLKELTLKLKMVLAQKYVQVPVDLLELLLILPSC